MSTRKGAGETRSRSQKHQNATVWKFDKNKTDSKTKAIQNVVVTNCCERCTGVIEWKIKYGKYKPLSQPSKCIRCSEKRVKSAYHQYCSACVRETGACAKCCQVEEVVRQPLPGPTETAKMESELQKELKLLPERKRRTFMRYLRQQERKARSTVPPESENPEDESTVAPPTPKKTLAQVHAECFEKLKDLNLKCAEDNVDDDFDSDDFDLDDTDESEEEEM